MCIRDRCDTIPFKREECGVRHTKPDSKLKTWTQYSGACGGLPLRLITHNSSGTITPLQIPKRIGMRHTETNSKLKTWAQYSGACGGLPLRLITHNSSGSLRLYCSNMIFTRRMRDFPIRFASRDKLLVPQTILLKYDIHAEDEGLEPPSPEGGGFQDR